MLRRILFLAAICFSTTGRTDEQVPVPPDATENQQSRDAFSAEEFLRNEFGVVLSDDPLAIAENLEPRNAPLAPFPAGHRIVEVSSRTWSAKTSRYSFDKKHRVGSMVKLASVLKGKQFQSCTILDFKLKDADNKFKSASFMRLSELDLKRGSGLQTDVPFGVAPTIPAK